jgi:tellurite methyltransferase
VRKRDGAYDEGYQSVPCFWGIEPGSLVKAVVATGLLGEGARVLDLGCGEGKNAAALAKLGCIVDAVDCSEAAIRNGTKAFATIVGINWIIEDAMEYEAQDNYYDLVICYGLLHCLLAAGSVDRLINRVKGWTTRGGMNIVCAFNDGPHDLSAHPNFSPLLLCHDLYLSLYLGWTLFVATDTLLNEVHPHNNIAHFHSMTRILARKP